MGAWQEIADYTVPSNTTSVVLDNFGTITKDDFVKVVTTFVNNSGVSDAVYSMYPNGNTTATNYHRQILQASGSGISAGRANNNFIGTVIGTASAFHYIKLSENNKYNSFTNYFRDNTSSLNTVFVYNTSVSDFASGITSLTFTSNQTNGLGTGSRIQIYKLAAEKVADITVASNTTQVDISNLSIDKDSEYLLVTDGIQGLLVSQYRMFINDDTTLTNYWSQRIRGIGSTTNASRANLPIVSVFGANRTIVYSHIKLSNIGAYTSQHYAIPDSGTSSLYLENYFHSGTAENITSITKINLTNEIANGIGAGSRFILYKLY